MRLDVLGLARALGAVAPAAGGIDDDKGRSVNADDDAAFASAWLQCGAVLALHHFQLVLQRGALVRRQGAGLVDHAAGQRRHRQHRLGRQMRNRNG